MSDAQHRAEFRRFLLRHLAITLLGAAAGVALHGAFRDRLVEPLGAWVDAEVFGGRDLPWAVPEESGVDSDSASCVFPEGGEHGGEHDAE